MAELQELEPTIASAESMSEVLGSSTGLRTKSGEQCRVNTPAKRPGHGGGGECWKNPRGSRLRAERNFGSAALLPETAKAQEAKQRLQVIETAVQATCRAQNYFVLSQACCLCACVCVFENPLSFGL